ncbi:polyadenylate-binding protein-interacting protein 1 isoform X2 [Pangasianodon hypophthalmus]|uniref:polyadenylate-binding protein-interacting protein 1 isoform X2 n=1 Tax=Pangasianodon hypophthalmus TaxID=310915 RepID=UPI00147AD1FF|nr:polyadenylate-binding protein-interacting protein 1 isoform X2 [Pangasianodon hypophthalmus]
MADNAEGFDRAPGAGRSRGKASGPGQGDSSRPREPELADGDAVFSRCQPLRQPRTPVPAAEGSDSSRAASTLSSSSSVSNSSSAAAAAVKPQPGQSAVYESRLSAHAPEFIPSTYTPVQEDVYEDDGYDGYYPEFSLADLVQDILSHLNSSPGSFETDIGSITATLNDWVTSEETLRELVELIFTQSTSMPNFTYTGARLCNFLSHHLTLSPASGNFRNLLLQRCHTEYNQRQQALMGDEETQRRFHTYVLFLGELYLNLEVKSVKGTMSRAEILLTALKDLMDTLFSQPKDRNLICAVKLLKLTGSVLEDAWKQSGKSHMDELIQKIEGILLDAQCSRDVRQMLLKLVELRSSNWGRVHAAAAYSEATPDNDPNYYMNEPTFYTADGTPFTAADPDYSEKYQEILEREDYFPEFYEENGNEALYGEEDEMEPEIEEAFEKFCLETERQKP